MSETPTAPKHPELPGLESQRDTLKGSIEQREARAKTLPDAEARALAPTLEMERRSLKEIEARIKALTPEDKPAKK